MKKEIQLLRQEIELLRKEIEILRSSKTLTLLQPYIIQQPITPYHQPYWITCQTTQEQNKQFCLSKAQNV